MLPTLTLEASGLWRAAYAGRVYWAEFKTGAVLWLASQGAFQ